MCGVKDIKAPSSFCPQTMSHFIPDAISVRFFGLVAYHEYVVFANTIYPGEMFHFYINAMPKNNIKHISMMVKIQFSKVEEDKCCNLG